MLTIRETVGLLQQWNQILILTHCRPDGDTVGSAVSLCEGLRMQGKTAYVLPNPEWTDTLRPIAEPYHAPEDFQPRRVIATDIATVNLLPDNAKIYQNNINLAIDHHPSFENFGQDNLCRPHAAACGEIIYDLLAALGPITPAMALPLYVAVSTDTGCFAYSNTTAHTHSVAAALISTGFDVRKINKIFFQTKSRKRMQLEAAMLNTCEFYDQERIAILPVPLELTARMQATASDTKDLSELGAQMQGVDCAVTMQELRENTWKVSMRSGSRINASEVCARLGGGGHAAAAGCMIENVGFQEAKTKILDSIKQQTDKLSGQN